MGYSDNPLLDAIRHYDAQDAYNDRRERCRDHAIKEITGGDVDATADCFGDWVCGLTDERSPMHTFGSVTGPVSNAELLSIILGQSANDQMIASAARELRARYLASDYAMKVVDNRIDQLAEEA